MTSITTVLYTSKILKDQSHPIYFRLNLHKKQHYLPVYKHDKRFSANITQWDKEKEQLICRKKTNPGYQELNNILDKRKNELRSIIESQIEQNEMINIKKIRHEFYREKIPQDVFSYIDMMISNSKSVTAGFLKALKRDLTGFTGGSSLSFDEIDYELVCEFIGYHEELDHNKTSIGISLRYLRNVLNHAIRNKGGSPSTYPFSNKYGAEQIINVVDFEKQERKLAIDPKIIEYLKQTTFDKKEDETAKRIFLTSYAARGMNFRDIARLTNNNFYTINNTLYLEYNRGKTGVCINIKVSPLLMEQLNWFKNNYLPYKGYLIPVIDSTFTDEFRYLTAKLNKFNYRLKVIEKKLGSKGQSLRLSSYTARHSFATALYHNGVDVNKISQSLAHKNVTSTKNYLARFDEDHLSKEIELITG